MSTSTWGASLRKPAGRPGASSAWMCKIGKSLQWSFLVLTLHFFLPSPPIRKPFRKPSNLERLWRVTARPLVLCVVFAFGWLCSENTHVRNDMRPADDLEKIAYGEQRDVRDPREMAHSMASHATSCARSSRNSARNGFPRSEICTITIFRK